MSEQPKVQVSVQGDPDIELFIVDHDLRLVQRVALPWTGELRAGLYRFKFRRGTTIDEETVFLDPGKPTVSFSAPALVTTSSAPLDSSVHKHEYHLAAAHSNSQMVHKKAGKGGQLYLFVRDWTKKDVPARTKDPAVGLQLFDTKGALVSDVPTDAAKGGKGTEDRWAALNLELNPGVYFLKLTTKDNEQLEQSIVVSPGWQTQVFLLLTDYRTKRPKDLRADLAEATVFMAKAGQGFSSNDEQLRLTDTALTWLVAGRRTAAGQALSALNLKQENPILALYAAHALITDRETSLAVYRETLEGRSETPPFDETTLRAAVSNLTRLLPGHPDVIALRLWLGEDAAAFAPMPDPPMLAGSWSIIVAASASQPSLIPRGSLAAKIGSCLYGSGAWLIWLPEYFTTEEASADVDVWEVLETVQRAKPRKKSLTWYKELDQVQRALLQYAEPKRSFRFRGGPEESMSSPAPQKPRSIEDLVLATGLPLSTLQDAAAGLSRASQQVGSSPRSVTRRREEMDS